MREELAQLGADLRAALEQLVLAVSPGMPRAQHLGRLLHLDKSLANRIMRSTRASDPLLALHESPLPQGLRIFLDATRGLAPPAAAAALEQTIARFEVLLTRLAGGRAGFDATLATWLGPARQRGERDARQSIYRGMAYLLGHHAEALAGAQLIVPSGTGKFADVVRVSLRVGLHRSRPTPIVLFSGRNVRPARGGTGLGLTLTGRIGRRGADYLLPQFCTPACPALRLIEEGENYRCVIDHDVTIPDGATVAFARRDNGIWARYRDNQRTHEWQTTVPRMPCTVLVSDVLVHEDLYPGPVSVSTQLEAAPVIDPRSGPGSMASLDHVDLLMDQIELAPGLRDLGTGEIPQYALVMRHAFASLGWDMRQFRGHRIRLRYPVPFVSVTRWFELPPTPRARRARRSRR